MPGSNYRITTDSGSESFSQQSDGCFELKAGPNNHQLNQTYGVAVWKIQSYISWSTCIKNNISVKDILS